MYHETSLHIEYTGAIVTLVAFCFPLLCSGAVMEKLIVHGQNISILEVEVAGITFEENDFI